MLFIVYFCINIRLPKITKLYIIIMINILENGTSAVNTEDFFLFSVKFENCRKYPINISRLKYRAVYWRNRWPLYTQSWKSYRLRGGIGSIPSGFTYIMCTRVRASKLHRYDIMSSGRSSVIYNAITVITLSVVRSVDMQPANQFCSRKNVRRQ